ncbi:MAG: hypothetical protein KJ057_17845 [Phycisphaerae bacterium]|nr:MAG: hypothetical protein EDS66_17510 [Planctomycetota bacterium]MBE7458534.1 hypothetical protein [Planctomycetia bacterium]MCL4720324.1 hypothetical protein [Phycisphaerae bacterium]
MAVTDYAISGQAVWNDGTADQFVGLQGRLVTRSTLANMAQKMSRDGTIFKLRIRVVSSSSNGATVITLMKNGNATLLTKSISANTSSSIVEENTTIVSFSAGDALAWRIDLPTAGPIPPDTTTLQWIAAQIGGGPEDDTVDYCLGGQYTATADAGFNPQQKGCVQGGMITGASLDDAEQKQSRAGTISDLRVRIQSHELGDSTLTLMKNGSATNLSVSFNNSDSFPGTFEDTTHSVSFSADDELAWQANFEDLSNGESTTLIYISAEVVFD